MEIEKEIYIYTDCHYRVNTLSSLLLYSFSKLIINIAGFLLGVEFVFSVEDYLESEEEEKEEQNNEGKKEQKEISVEYLIDYNGIEAGERKRMEPDEAVQLIKDYIVRPLQNANNRQFLKELIQNG